MSTKKTKIQDILEGLLKSIKDELLKVDNNEEIEKYTREILNHIKLNNDFKKEQELLKEIKELKELESTEDDEINTKIELLKCEKKKYMQKNYPYNLVCGDIIYVKYGIGIADEINGGHYGVVLSQKGSMFLIAPLTSKPQNFGENNVCFKNLGLPSKEKIEEEKSYISFTQIRYIHCRRIENISTLKYGRLHIDKTDIDNILDKHNKIITLGRKV